MITTLLKPDVAFGAVAPHQNCCDCCDGYCPIIDAEEWQGVLWAFTAEDGTEYLTDRYVMLRRDLIDTDELKQILNVPHAEWAVVPAEKPPLSDAPQGIYVLDLCDLFGITRHVYEDKPTVVHLYAGDDHIGWTTIATKGPFPEPADLPAVRKIAGTCGLDLGRALKAYHLAHGVEL